MKQTGLSYPSFDFWRKNKPNPRVDASHLIKNFEYSEFMRTGAEISFPLRVSEATWESIVHWNFFPFPDKLLIGADISAKLRVFDTSLPFQRIYKFAQWYWVTDSEKIAMASIKERSVRRPYSPTKNLRYLISTNQLLLATEQRFEVEDIIASFPSFTKQGLTRIHLIERYIDVGQSTHSHSSETKRQD